MRKSKFRDSNCLCQNSSPAVSGNKVCVPLSPGSAGAGPKEGWKLPTRTWCQEALKFPTLGQSWGRTLHQDFDSQRKILTNESLVLNWVSKITKYQLEKYRNFILCIMFVKADWKSHLAILIDCYWDREKITTLLKSIIGRHWIFNGQYKTFGCLRVGIHKRKSRVKLGAEMQFISFHRCQNQI